MHSLRGTLSSKFALLLIYKDVSAELASLKQVLETP